MNGMREREGRMQGGKNEMGKLCPPLQVEKVFWAGCSRYDKQSV